MAQSAVERKGAAWKEVLRAENVVPEDKCMKIDKEKSRKVKRCIYQCKREVNDQFGRKMNQDIDENRKLFWKVKVGKVESCNRISDGSGRMKCQEPIVRRTEVEMRMGKLKCKG